MRPKAERKVHEAKQDFDRCGKLIKTEMARFEEERIQDFKLALQAFVDGMIERQKTVSLNHERRMLAFRCLILVLYR